MFEEHGAVQSCSLVMDKETGESKGFGFVEMPKQGEARVAMKNINGKEIEGNKLRVKKAEPKTVTGNVANQKNNPGTDDPMHGVTLEMILERLLEKFDWEELGRRIRIKCFTIDPGITSSLKFLRKTPWARQKVEKLYLDSIQQDTARPAKRNTGARDVDENKADQEKKRWKPRKSKDRNVWGNK